MVGAWVESLPVRCPQSHAHVSNSTETEAAVTRTFLNHALTLYLTWLLLPYLII